MANRSYLYAANHVPGSPVDEDTSPVGMSEWSNGIPFVYKLLLSPAPSICASPMDPTVKTVICGPYEEGLDRFKNFTKKICTPAAQPLIREALMFLEDSANRRKYFLLECFEIFDLQEEPHEVQASSLLEELRALESSADTHIRSLETAAGRSDRTLIQALRNLGFGYWSTVLYFELSDEPGDRLPVEDDALSEQWLAEQKQKEEEYLAYFCCQIEVIADESLAPPLSQLNIYVDGNVNSTRRNDNTPPGGELIRVAPGKHRIVIREPFDQAKESRLESNTLHFCLRKGDAARFVITSTGEEIAISQQRNVSRAGRRQRLPRWINAIAMRIKAISTEDLKHTD